MALLYRLYPVDFSTPLYSFVKKCKVVEKKDSHGAYKTVVAEENIVQGGFIWIDRSDEHPSLRLTKADVKTIESWDEAKRKFFLTHAWQLGADEFCGPASQAELDQDAHFLIRHSCNPNTFLCVDYGICARLKVNTGDELTLDFSTIRAHPIFDKYPPPGVGAGGACQCGTPFCRGTIKHDDYLMRELEVRYGVHFTNHILQLIDKSVSELDEAKRPKHPPLPGLADGKKTYAELVVNGSGDENYIEYCSTFNPKHNRADFGVGTMHSSQKSVEIQENKLLGGFGLYAKEFIPKGTVIWREYEHYPDERFFTLADLAKIQNEMYELEKAANKDTDAKAPEVGADGKLKANTKPGAIISGFHFMFQLGEDCFCGPATVQEAQRDSMNYMNHVCDPTVGFKSDKEMVTLRDVQKGEQIAYDYGTTETALERFPSCLCGFPNCRGKLTPTDYLKPELQAKYKGYFIGYLAERIAKQNPTA